MYYTNKLKGKPLQMMGYKVTGSKRCKPQDSLTARLNRIWNDYLRYINFNGYDYTRKDGWSFSVSK